MSAALQVDRGTSVRIRTVFEVAAVDTDPTTVTLEVKDPTGTTTTYTYAAAQITKEGTGIFYRDTAITIVGTWHVRMTGTGTVPSSAWAAIECRWDPF